MDSLNSSPLSLNSPSRLSVRRCDSPGLRLKDRYSLSPIKSPSRALRREDVNFPELLTPRSMSQATIRAPSPHIECLIPMPLPTPSPVKNMDESLAIDKSMMSHVRSINVSGFPYEAITKMKEISPAARKLGKAPVTREEREKMFLTLSEMTEGDDSPGNFSMGDSRALSKIHVAFEDSKRRLAALLDEIKGAPDRPMGSYSRSGRFDTGVSIDPPESGLCRTPSVQSRRDGTDEAVVSPALGVRPSTPSTRKPSTTESAEEAPAFTFAASPTISSAPPPIKTKKDYLTMAHFGPLFDVACDAALKTCDDMFQLASCKETEAKRLRLELRSITGRTDKLDKILKEKEELKAQIRSLHDQLNTRTKVMLTLKEGFQKELAHLREQVSQIQMNTSGADSINARCQPNNYNLFGMETLMDLVLANAPVDARELAKNTLEENRRLKNDLEMMKGRLEETQKELFTRQRSDTSLSASAVSGAVESVQAAAAASSFAGEGKRKRVDWQKLHKWLRAQADSSHEGIVNLLESIGVAKDIVYWLCGDPPEAAVVEEGADEGPTRAVPAAYSANHPTALPTLPGSPLSQLRDWLHYHADLPPSQFSDWMRSLCGRSAADYETSTHAQPLFEKILEREILSCVMRIFMFSSAGIAIEGAGYSTASVMERASRDTSRRASVQSGFASGQTSPSVDVSVAAESQPLGLSTPDLLHLKLHLTDLLPKKTMDTPFALGFRKYCMESLYTKLAEHQGFFHDLFDHYMKVVGQGVTRATLSMRGFGLLCKHAHLLSPSLPLAEVNRMFVQLTMVDENGRLSVEDIHASENSVRMKDFLAVLVRIAGRRRPNAPINEAVESLISLHLRPNAMPKESESLLGIFYSDTCKKAFLKSRPTLIRVYKFYSKKGRESEPPRQDITMTFLQFLDMLRDTRCLDSVLTLNHVRTAAVKSVLYPDVEEDPFDVPEGEEGPVFEMTYVEFCEALLRCAIIKCSNMHGSREMQRLEMFLSKWFLPNAKKTAF